MNGNKTEDDIAGKAEFDAGFAEIPLSLDEEDTPGDDAEAAPEPEEDLAVRVTQLESDLAAARQEVLYARAEEQNTRRRLEQDKASGIARAAEGFARDILSVADNMERALAAIPDDLRADDKMKGLVVGLEATGKELDSVFRKHGIEPIEAVGQPLDPNRHQAMIEVPSDDAEPGTIVQEMQKGYMIRDRLLRPSLVGVARKQ